MKQFIISILIIMGMFIMMGDKIVIPKEAIRLRVIANSNSKYDQEIKMIVKEEIEKDLGNILNNTINIEDARTKIQNNISNISKTVDNTLKNNNYNLDYTINFGYNYFPAKEYKGITYEEGNYESLVVTLGSGEGDNWWCVLFPPFCLIEAEESDEIEYKWKVKELIDKYF